MTSTILEILQQRVQTLSANLEKTQSKIALTHEQIKQNQNRLAEAQKTGDLNTVRECLSLQQQLEEQIPALEKSLTNIQKSHRLFERQLAQNAAAKAL